MPARLILIYYFGVPARFIYKRCAQLADRYVKEINNTKNEIVSSMVCGTIYFTRTMQGYTPRGS
jgi:hypothetical protein